MLLNNFVVVDTVKLEKNVSTDSSQLQNVDL